MPIEKEAILIQEINNFFRIYFQLTYDLIQPNGLRRYVIQGNSRALNHKRYDSEEVGVLNWFGNFYLFIEIRFIEETTNISLSIFNGKESDNKKHQLFRAEWDDYNRDNETHPQPHWHITTDKAIANNYEAALPEKDANSFEYFEIAKSDVYDIKEIHFAMIGNWHNEESHIHKIDGVDKVAKWLKGLLEHIRFELETT